MICRIVAIFASLASTGPGAPREEIDTYRFGTNSFAQETVIVRIWPCDRLRYCCNVITMEILNHNCYSFLLKLIVFMVFEHRSFAALILTKLLALPLVYEEQEAEIMKPVQRILHCI
jgi:hypothetical protein